MKYCAVRVSKQLHRTWEDWESHPVDFIMKIPNGQRLYMRGTWIYPDDTYNHLTYIGPWEYDLLDAFDVPDITDTLLPGLNMRYDT